MKRSLVSRLVTFSVRFGWIPVRREGDSYLFSYLFYLLALMTAARPTFYPGIVSQLFHRNNSVDALTIILFTMICYIFGPAHNWWWPQ